MSCTMASPSLSHVQSRIASPVSVRDTFQAPVSHQKWGSRNNVLRDSIHIHASKQKARAYRKPDTTIDKIDVVALAPAMKQSEKGKGGGTQKRVSFDENEAVHTLPYYLADSEKENVWFTQKEQSEIEADSELIMFKIGNGQKLRGETLRGLEYHSEQGKWDAYQNRREVWNAVLGEQERQQRLRISDPKAIGKLSGKASFQCRYDAVRRGLDDATEAKRVTGRAARSASISLTRSKCIQSCSKAESKGKPPLARARSTRRVCV